MIDRLFWPVVIDDRSQWSDEQIIGKDRYPYRNTESLTNWLNSVYHRNQQRVVPGSIEHLSSGIRLRVSNVLWKVNRIEYLAVAELKDPSGIWHARYQLCNANKIGDNGSEIDSYLLEGIPKPWNVPIGYVLDGDNIVLIRSKIVEDFLKRHLLKLFYDNGRLMADIDGKTTSITEYVGNHSTKKQEQDITKN